MAQQVRRRRQKIIQYEENSIVPENLGRGMVYRELYLKLHGSFTPTAAVDHTPDHIMCGDEWGVVKRIQLIANNTDVIKSFSGNELWWLNYFMYGVPPHITPELGDASAAAAIPFTSCLILPLWMPRSLRPMDTALDARELSDLKLEITWGDLQDILEIDAGAANAWTVEPTIEIHSLESYNVSGPFSQWRVYKIQKTITGVEPQFQVILPVGPMYRGFLINTTQYDALLPGPGQVDAPGVMSNFKILSGSTVFADVPTAILDQIDSWQRSSIINPFDSNAALPAVPAVAATTDYDHMKSGIVSNNRGAWYFYDHVTDGFLTEAIDTLGFSEFSLELNVTNAGFTAPVQINILPLQIIPVRG